MIVLDGALGKNNVENMTERVEIRYDLQHFRIRYCDSKPKYSLDISTAYAIL